MSDTERPEPTEAAWKQSDRGYLEWGALPRPLEGFDGERPAAPGWFTRAIADEGTTTLVEVEGARIEAISWGDPAAQGMLLFHGSMGHARWWEGCAQLLAEDYHVTALSFSGMGGSDWRDAYSVRQSAREALAVAEACGNFANDARPIIVAHSFGGKAASILAGDHGDRFAGLAFVDSFIVPQISAAAPPYRPRFYDTLGDALGRFRLSPDQPTENLYMVDAIGRGGLRQQDGKWTWKFDPDFFLKATFDNAWDEVRASKCPLAFIRGEYSPIVNPGDFAMLRKEMRADSRFVTIPDAYHHVMVDQPLALVTAIRALASDWRT